MIYRVDATGHQVFVNLPAWRYFNIDAKKGFAISLAAYCDLNSSDHTRFVDVMNAENGQKLASYGAFGFKTY